MSILITAGVVGLVGSLLPHGVVLAAAAAVGALLAVLLVIADFDPKLEDDPAIDWVKAGLGMIATGAVLGRVLLKEGHLMAFGLGVFGATFAVGLYLRRIFIHPPNADDAPTAQTPPESYTSTASRAGTTDAPTSAAIRPARSARRRAR